MTSILITGAAGFIGNCLALRFLSERATVVGLDNLNDYYDPCLKSARLDRVLTHPRFHFTEIDLLNRVALDALFTSHKFDIVINLAAQAGVRYSLTNPHAYLQSNMEGFLNILECCRHHKTGHLLYASSSSVYGAVTKMPFSVSQNVDHPISMYAASKKSNELMAHCYSHLFGLPSTGLRFFTVYGPWGRPDMALFIFTRAILAGKPIQVFNNGIMQRDFTYIDDIVEGIYRLSKQVPSSNPLWNSELPDPASSSAPYRLYNIGNSAPVSLMYVIGLLEQYLNTKAIMEMLPMQPGDVPVTYAEIESFANVTGFRPSVSIEEGVRRFVDWYQDFYGAKYV